MNQYEIIIIGAGPGGLQAAIHSSRRRHKVLILGKPENSALFKAHIENYFGIEEKVEGSELILKGLSQALKFGAELLKEDVVKIEILGDGTFRVETEKGKDFQALSLILALGVKKKKKLFNKEDFYIGKGVSYCVDCDAWFYRGKKVVVIGDGSAGVHGAKTLTNFAGKVYFVPLREIPEIEEEFKKSSVEILLEKPKDLLGEEEVKGVIFESGKVLEVDGIFIELGSKGPLELLAPLGIELDGETLSYVKVNSKMETNIPGVFACGDLTGPPFQLAKAVGEGCVAGLSASDYLKAKFSRNT